MLLEISNDFIDKFTPVFISGVIISLIFSVLIGYFKEKIIKPKLRIHLNFGASNSATTLVFECHNSGEKILKPNNLFWCVYFPMGLKPINEFENSFQLIILDNKPYYKLSGYNKYPILPKNSNILTEVNIIHENVNQSELESKWFDDLSYFYSMTTEKGHKKYENFFWDYFKKVNYHIESPEIKRPVLKISKPSF